MHVLIFFMRSSLSFCRFQNQNSSAKAMSNQSYKEKYQRKEDNMHFVKQRNDAYVTNLIASQQKRAFQDVVVGQPPHQQHAALARTVSTPVTDANQVVVNSIFTSLNDILNGTATNGHRKLERTQSEPIPQTNTSRYVRL
jgi:hypothetical protein